MATIDEIKQRFSSMTATPTGQQYDAQYDEAVRGIQGGLANLESNTNLAKQRAASDFETGKRNLAESHTKQLDTLRERLANQGILRSGINIGEQGRIGTEVAKRAGEMQQGYQRGVEDIDREYATRQQQFNSQLSQLNVDRARRESERQEQVSREEAQRKANEELANNMRIQLDEMKERMLKAVQPQPSPTGQFQLPPPIPPPQPPIAIAAPPRPAPVNTQAQILANKISPVDVQKHLQRRGFYTGRIDGIFGANSQRALAAWKQSVGLPADSAFDPSIYQQLVSSGIGNISPTGGSTVYNPGPARRSV